MDLKVYNRPWAVLAVGGIALFAVREIARKLLHSTPPEYRPSDSSSDESSAQSPWRVKVVSETTPGVVYEVDVHKKTCTCPHFMYRGTPCKHMKKVLDGSFVKLYK